MMVEMGKGYRSAPEPAILSVIAWQERGVVRTGGYCSGVYGDTNDGRVLLVESSLQLSSKEDVA